MLKIMYIKINQKGASPIMFTMFFIIIVSLITIGFATLARRDQRAALDKTLSNQAQFAAESGVNAVNDYVKRTLATGGGYTAVQQNSNCDIIGPLATQIKKPDFVGSGASITCLTWDNTPTEAIKTLEPYEGWSFNHMNHQGFTTLKWTTKNNVKDNYLLSATGSIPSISSNNKSIIKIATVNREDIYKPINPGGSKFTTVYLVPYTAGPGQGVIPFNVTVGIAGGCATGNTYVDLGASCNGTQSDRSNGMVYYVPCNPSRSDCEVNIQGYTCPTSGCSGGNYGDRLFYFQAIGNNPVDLEYASTSAGVRQELINVSVKVDSNAKATDVSKRVIAYINLQDDIWRPDFATLATDLCKNIKVDGDQTDGVNGTALCPALP